MTKSHSHLKRGFLAGTALLLLSAGVASAADLATPGQRNVVNDQRIDQASEGPIPSLTSTVDGHFGVDTQQSSAQEVYFAIDANSQSASVAGNAAATKLSAKEVRTDNDAWNDGSTPFSVLINQQNGSGDAKADAKMTIAVPGEVGAANISLSSNANNALSRMNDAANTADVEIIGIAGDNLLSSEQNAAGTVTATATSDISGGADAVRIQSSRYNLQHNAVTSEATANRVLNGLSVTAFAVPPSSTVLDSQQVNDAAVNSTGKLILNVSGSGAYQSTITFDGNAASSLARGNVAENQLSLIGGASAGGGDTPALSRSVTVSSLAISPSVQGATLTNLQTNNGAVTADTNIAVLGSLNCECMRDSRLDIANGSAAASAYGNTALNAGTVDGRSQPYALVSNTQINNGPISASVTGNHLGVMAAGITSGMTTITGNSLAAVAIGNQSVNSIVAGR